MLTVAQLNIAIPSIQRYARKLHYRSPGGRGGAGRWYDTDHEDMAQEALLAAWQARDTFIGDDKAAGRWVRRILFTKFLNAETNQKRWQLVRDRLETAGNRTREQMIADEITRPAQEVVALCRQVVQAAMPLNGRRELFDQAVGFTVNEIAKRDGLSHTTVQSRSERAAEVLCNVFAEDGVFAEDDQNDEGKTTAEAADYLGLAPRYLVNLRYWGVGPKWRRVGSRSVRYDIADLDEWQRDRQEI